MIKNGRSFRRAMTAWKKNRRGRRKPVATKRLLSKYRLAKHKKLKRS